MKLGLKPIARKDHRTYDFRATFGALSPDVIPQEFNFDVSGVMPDQNADGAPNGCTAYTENDIASNDDSPHAPNDEMGENTIYYDDQLFTYNNTKQIEGVDGQVPVSIMDALKAGTVYGVKKKNETPDQALCHRRAPYFIIQKNPDYFSGLISAMWLKQGGLSIGTPWPAACHWVGKDGIVPSFAAPKFFTEGHCWAAVGVKSIGNLSYIICKSWQGSSFGDKGYCYFNREQINALLAVRGSGAFGQKHASPGDIQTVQLTILETILSYLALWANKLMGRLSGRSNLGSTGECGIPNVPAVPEPVQPQSKPLDRLTTFCLAVKDYEGYYAPGENPQYPHGTRAWNNKNPGNLKYAGQKGSTGKDDKGFAIFSDHVVGFNALMNQVQIAANGTSKVFRPTDSFYDFFRKYAPREDSNDPRTYAEFVAKKVGLSPTASISQLLT